MSDLPISRPALERVYNPDPTPAELRRVINAFLDDIEGRLEGIEAFTELPTTALRAYLFQAQDTEPADKQEGMVALADDTTWDPLTLTLGRPYWVGYSGGSWHRLDV